MKSLKKRLIKFLDLTAKHNLKKNLEIAFKRVLSSGNFILGKEVKSFEQNFAKYLGVKYCIGVGNGLEAIQIALMSLKIGPGDEVITTPVSAAATTLAILAVGAIPVFVDTNDEGLINPDLMEKAITKKTKAILPVHLYGNPSALDKMHSICKKNNLYLIEDAAQAHGSKFNKKYLGTFGDLGCFSFYPTKNLGALGDAGALVTNNLRLYQICREVRDYGQRSKYQHVRFGLNSRLDELQASFLSLKLKTLESDNAKRQILARKYIKNLSPILELKIIKPENLSDANFHLFVIKTKKIKQLKKYLQENGIQTLIHFPKIIPDQPFLKSLYKNLCLPKAQKFVKTCLSLPLYPQMNLEEIDFVSDTIIKFFQESK